MGNRCLGRNKTVWLRRERRAVLRLLRVERGQQVTGDCTDSRLGKK